VDYVALSPSAAASDLSRLVVGFLDSQCGLAPNSYSYQTALFSSGLLDSFAMLALISFLEHEVGVILLTEEVTQSNVDSIDSLISWTMRAIQAKHDLPLL
jgi:hypothetical protein